MCDELPTAYSLRYRTHLFYTEFDYQSVSCGRIYYPSRLIDFKQTVDVSLVTHLTTERLASLDEVLSRWRGPASVALYVTDSEVYRFKQYLKHCPSVNRKNVAFHIVYQEGAIYPINQLKNVALTNVVTPFVLLVDADFIPADDLYADLIIAIKNQGDLRKKALIVPAFETFSYQLDFPNTKSELLQMLEDDQIFSFKLVYHFYHLVN
ncbi:unnamed protein product [Soboliphyme baturini]|uniref:Glyco_transf_64 domain-containing protein n=1 Tax=Soboliphyme baturini TaxID=241478 RepID=A0A183IAX5_9BILA|nr:unnamed protein product [Soboliphyme baturini]